MLSLFTVRQSFRTKERRSALLDRLSEDLAEGFCSFLTSATGAMPANANTACAAAIEMLLSRVAVALEMAGQLERGVDSLLRASFC